MLSFNDLTILNKTSVVIDPPSKGRYIIGYDPFYTDATGKNTLTVYDKKLMRVTTTIKTEKPFEQVVEKFLEKELDKKSFVASYKFVKDGRCKTAEEIRNENQAGNKQSEGNTTTLQS